MVDSLSIKRKFLIAKRNQTNRSTMKFYFIESIT